MTQKLDYLHHLRVESARFADVLRETRAGSRVPTCPDWDADDLLWHLAEVQWFWSRIVRDDLADPSTMENPERPTDRAGLLAFYDSASADLQRTLAETDPAAHRWTWSTEQTAGFTRRRQAHEALIHRVDAELTAGVGRSKMDVTLCADGVDEALRIMFGGSPDWGRTEPDPGATLRIETTDTPHSWVVTLGRFTGTDPDGVTHDEPDLLVATSDTGEDTAATLRGTAADVDCALWGRPTAGQIDRLGDVDVLASFEAFIGQGVE